MNSPSGVRKAEFNGTGKVRRLEKKNAGMLAPVECALLSFGIQRGKNAGIKNNEQILLADK